MKCDSSKIKNTSLLTSDKELAQLCKALGHEARIMILRVLIHRNSCICGEIVNELPISQSTVSQHLKILKDSEIIQGEVQGPAVCYCINPTTIKRLKALIKSTIWRSRITLSIQAHESKKTRLFFVFNRQLFIPRGFSRYK